MAEAIKKKFDIDPKMIEGKGGIFEVHVNGTQIWCKKDVDRFPEHDEILSQIDALSAKS